MVDQRLLYEINYLLESYNAPYNEDVSGHFNPRRVAKITIDFFEGDDDYMGYTPDRWGISVSDDQNVEIISKEYQVPKSMDSSETLRDAIIYGLWEVGLEEEDINPDDFKWDISNTEAVWYRAKGRLHESLGDSETWRYKYETGTPTSQMRTSRPSQYDQEAKWNLISRLQKPEVQGALKKILEQMRSISPELASKLETMISDELNSAQD